MSKRVFERVTPELVSVVIPHRGEDELLQICLERLRAQDYEKNCIEVIIVLNEPNDRALGFPLESHEIKVWEPTGFSYRSRNVGISLAKGSVIMLTDSDTAPDRSWIKCGVDALQSGTDIVAGHIDVTRKSAWNPFGLYEAFFAFDQEKNAQHAFCATANLVTHRSTFEKFGQFMDSASSGEDFEWTHRAACQGATVRYHAEVRVDHPARETLASLLAKARRTTAFFAAQDNRTPEHAELLRRRFDFAIKAKPSKRRAQAFGLGAKALARTVRLFVQSYKVLCLLRVIPKFNQLLRVHNQPPRRQQIDRSKETADWKGQNTARKARRSKLQASWNDIRGLNRSRTPR